MSAFSNRRASKICAFAAIFFVFLFLPSVTLEARGNPEDPFVQADKLIKERRFVDALTILVGVTRSDGEVFDKAQSRIRKILRSENRYTEIAFQLLDTLEKHPENADKIFELSNLLDTEGKARNEKTQEFIADIQEVARYTVYRNRVEDILAEGRRLIDAGNYRGAFDKYLTGLPIYQEVFENSAAPPAVKSQVTALKSEIRGMGTPFASVTERITPTAAEFSTLAKNADSSVEGIVRASAAFQGIDGDIDDLVELKQELWRIRDSYRNFEDIESMKEGRHHINFNSLLINGRPNQDVSEGFLGAVDGLWRSLYGPLEEIFDKSSDKIFSDIRGSIEGSAFTSARSRITEAENAMKGPANMLAAVREFTRYDDGTGRTIFGVESSITDENFFVLLESFERILPLLDSTVDSAARVGDAQRESDRATTVADYNSGRISATAAIERERNARAGLETINTDIRNLKEKLEGNLAQVSPHEVDVKSAEKGARYFREALKLLKEFEDNLTLSRIASAQRLYTVENNDYKNPYPTFVSSMDRSQKLLRGEEVTMSDGTRYESRDPLEALLILESLNASLDGAVQEGERLVSMYNAEAAEIAASSQIVPLKSAAQNQLALYGAMRREGVALADASRRNINEAEALRVEGARLYQEARARLSQNQFDASRGIGGMADENYAGSLSIQDSNPLRREWLDRYSSLKNEIDRLEYDYVSRQVSALVDRAQTEFYADHYDASLEVLMTAEETFSKVSKEEHPDVSYWISIVRNALTLRIGRTIPFTAPLYPEMSQLLSAAEICYNDGRSFLNTGARDAAATQFESAKQKLRDVKLVFPLNREAGILNLRIEQLEDPKGFSESFARRLELAEAGIKRGNLESFADLQDLAEINPSYRGMAQLVFQAEIDIGLRPPPPNTEAIARSRSLAVSAQNMVSQGIRSNLEVAEAQLNEALRIDPNNALAASELDRVHRLMGQRAVSNREAAVEGEYQKALSEFQAGNTVVAYSIVRRVLARPEYSNSSRFIELRQRIESIL